MIDYVSETLQRWRRTPFAWNGEDCLMSIADYALPIMKWDFGAPFRGRYNSEREAYALIEAAGGPFKVFDASGLARVRTPERGDVLLIEIGTRATGALCTRGAPLAAALEPGEPMPRGRFYAALRRPRGVAEIDLSLFPIIGIWSIPKCLPLQH